MAWSVYQCNMLGYCMSGCYRIFTSAMSQNITPLDNFFILYNTTMMFRCHLAVVHHLH